MVDYVTIFEKLYDNYGPQGWWPANSRFEISVGAILTQNTMWRNVVVSIKNLENAGLMEPYRMYIASSEKLANLIRPSGFPKLKAGRLKNFLSFFSEFSFDFEILDRFDTKTLSELLLKVNGIGEETANSMLLYIFERPVFISDAYSKRLFLRIGIKENFEITNVMKDSKTLGEFHALIVQHSKVYCRSKPICQNCPLLGICEYGEKYV
ncbi:MAG: endonuclease III domain-containing protein [Athalassotoga sp.]|uniref:endonuclease III domain-containing protein n=1 Tax=Athalassotoga sp. TaxID=2022597 RepID=UPI003D01577A